MCGFVRSSMGTWYVPPFPPTSPSRRDFSKDVSVCRRGGLRDAQTAVFKNQIDWIPLSTGSVRPTQGRTLAIAQVSGGSQSFNTVNSLRILGRWMRMFAIPNQSSIPKAYTQFTSADDVAEGGSRLMLSGNRERLVDCMEEFVKYSLVMRPHFALFGDRYSEREEKRGKEEKARLQEEEKKKAEEDAGNVNGVRLDAI
jgi:arsenic resistance protein ArsH